MTSENEKKKIAMDKSLGYLDSQTLNQTETRERKEEKRKEKKRNTEKKGNALIFVPRRRGHFIHFSARYHT
jgi:hypothetical protein